MNKAQELIKWFQVNGDETYSIWDFEQIKGDGYIPGTYEIEGQGRWETSFSAVWKFEDDSYVRLYWDEGSTEYQDSTSPNISMIEVKPYETMVVKYRKVDL